MFVANELNPTARFLMGPGPSDVHPLVLKAMATPLIGHLDPQFIEIMDGVKEMLRALFRTKNDLTFAVSATGSAGMETCFVNLLEPGDEALVCVNGVFGNRMCDNVERCGGKLMRVDAAWGQPIEPEQVKEALSKCKPKLVAIVHAETSTGVLQPLEEISRMVHDAGALFLVDTVTSLGGMDVLVDDWGIDAVYSGTQKCISCPPGLSPVSFSERAIKVIENRKAKVQSWYLDLTMVRKYWEGKKRVYHHTAPVSMIYGLYEALRLIFEEGLEERFERHRHNHELLRDGLEEMGFEFLVASQFRLPMLNAVKIPDGLDDAAVRQQLLDEYNIEIGAGLGDFAGKVWRIGLMGCSCTEGHVNKLLSALQKIMNKK
ncbi:MAG: pyridoxal-phosphate-dependent aminotransferase family protein [Planctomycetota bacterium]|jgi:alanine-glyoxylate transaminase/serine-glyoxylate transaminase/serine-pyruvate transaminase